MEKNFGNNIPLINLFDLFYSMQPNIEKIETTSRFYNAMAHLEFIGIVKFISENLIRFTDFLLLRELVTDK
jgi:hypothetical protein